MESAQAKNQALKEAGAIVPTSYEALEAAIKETFEKLVKLHYMTLFYNIKELYSTTVLVLIFVWEG